MMIYSKRECMKKIAAYLSSFAYMLTGCSDLKPQDYEQKSPKLDLRQFMNGPIDAWGIIYDYRGKVKTEFYVLVVGSWNGNTGTLDEEFTFSDGRKNNRVWTIEMIDDHRFTATAPDVEGQATGEQYGNTANMHYVLKIPRSNGKTLDVTMNDWLYLVDNKTIINRAKMHKYGLALGELVITFRKQ